MAVKNQITEPQEEGTSPVLLDVGVLREKHHTSWAIFAGVCSVNGWKPGKMIDEGEYLSAVDQFARAPINAR